MICRLQCFLGSENRFETYADSQSPGLIELKPRDFTQGRIAEFRYILRTVSYKYMAVIFGLSGCCGSGGSGSREDGMDPCMSTPSQIPTDPTPPDDPILLADPPPPPPQFNNPETMAKANYIGAVIRLTVPGTDSEPVEQYNLPTGTLTQIPQFIGIPVKTTDVPSISGWLDHPVQPPAGFRPQGPGRPLMDYGRHHCTGWCLELPVRGRCRRCSRYRAACRHYGHLPIMAKKGELWP